MSEPMCVDCGRRHLTGGEAAWCSLLVWMTGKTNRRPERPQWRWVQVGGGYVRQRVV